MTRGCTTVIELVRILELRESIDVSLLVVLVATSGRKVLHLIEVF